MDSVDLHAGMISAIESDWTTEVQSILQHYSAIYQDMRKVVHMDLALSRACRKGNCLIVELLVQYGADLCYSDSVSLKPIHHAAQCKHGAVVRYIIEESRLAANMVDLNDWTALHYAANVGSLECVQTLLAYGSTKSQMWHQANNGTLPIHMAAHGGHLEIIKELVLAGSSVNHSGGRAMATPLLKAVFGNHLEVVKYLLEEGANLYQCDIDSRAPLLIAAAIGSIEIVEFILHIIDSDRRCSVNVVDRKSHTALHMCVTAPVNGAEIMRMLIKAGASIHCMDSNGMTALHHAAQMGKHDILEILLEHGAKADGRVNQRDSVHGNTALSLAASMTQTYCVEMLLHAGACVNITDFDNNSPLHKVFMSHLEGKTEIIEMLIRNGAVINTHNNNGQSPFDLLAIQCSSLSGNPRRPSNICLDDLKLLVEAGVDLFWIERGQQRLRGNQAMSPLFFLMHGFQSEAVEYLIEKGWDLSKEHWLTLSTMDDLILKLNADNDNIELLQYVMHNSQQALPLKTLCRLKLRKHLFQGAGGRHINVLVEKLCLPNRLKDFLLMQH